MCVIVSVCVCSWACAFYNLSKMGGKNQAEKPMGVLIVINV